MISVQCPSCKKVHSSSEAALGKKVRCNDCKHVFVVPAGPRAQAAPSATAAAAMYKIIGADGQEYGPVDANALRRLLRPRR